MADVGISLEVAKQVEEIRKAGGELTDEGLKQLAKPITQGFRVKRDELAILRLSTDGKVLHFLYPILLSKIGAIPLTLTHSLAAKTIREKRGEIVNNFSGYKHPTVFEAVDLSEEDKATPIQKIMSVPMIVEGKVLGVIQVCRKGRQGEPSGPDFASADLAELTSIGSILAKFLSTLPPPTPSPAKPAKAEKT